MEREDPVTNNQQEARGSDTGTKQKPRSSRHEVRSKNHRSVTSERQIYTCMVWSPAPGTEVLETLGLPWAICISLVLHNEPLEKRLESTPMR